MEIPNTKAISQDLEVDVAVIGAGMAGVLTAYFLQQEGRQVAVFEANRIGAGQTSGTTAKITSQHGLIYDRLIRQLGMGAAQQYAAANQRAVEDYKELIGRLGIDCDLEEQNAYLYATKDKKELEKEVQAALSLGLPASLTEKTTLPFPTVGAVCFKNQAQFHPLKFLKAISRQLTIYEKSRVEKVEGRVLTLGRHTVSARHVVFATHYPFVNAPGYYFSRMYQSRAYSMALRGATPPDGMYVDTALEGLSLRAYGDLAILCGEDHNTGENREGGRYEALRRRAAELYPGCEEVARWSAQDCMTSDGVPYIGRYSSDTRHWYVATGFGKWGMSSSMVAARILTGLITGKPDENGDVFSPQRFALRDVPSMVEEGGRAVKGLTLELFSIPRAQARDLPAGHGGVVELNGETVGVYKHEDGTIFAVQTRCPHLGCQLEWNPDERSWDCPCHGSRFDYAGRWINGPAQQDLPSVHL